MDVEFVDDVLSSVAAAEIMPRFGRLSTADVVTKTSAFDIVSTADWAAEKAITEAIRHEHARATVIGEEAAANDPGIVGSLDEADLAFVLDPLDGTKNFVAGLPLFAVMAAVVERGRIVAGVIHDPVTRTSAIATEGGGAWLRRDGTAGTRLRVADPAPVNEMEAVAGTQFLPDSMRSVVTANLSALGGYTWFRCAGHEYRMAAAGHCHLLSYNRLMPWDHAAGWLLHREAGGFSAHFDGSPFRVGRMSGGLLCAPDEDSWHAAHRTLFAGVSTS
ncbi:inositol monophosphatase family protein [Pseudonocardia sp. CA-142604]|uniref:inositol monophosphatase family protein n=1 Tax=Pseudonocardia sp. CA-142604 TaxID=3240024 RepID=UPI003D90982A